MGGIPYTGIRSDDLFQYMREQKIMQQPACCPNEFYEVWETNLLSAHPQGVNQHLILAYKISHFSDYL